MNLREARDLAPRPRRRSEATKRRRRLMKSRLLGAILSVLLWAVAGRADVTDPTPYDYDHPPKAGREGGTYAFSATGSAGPDCVIALIGALKLLPNGAGTGGNIC